MCEAIQELAWALDSANVQAAMVSVCAVVQALAWALDWASV